MNKVIVSIYDFDGAIYEGDASKDFILFTIAKYPYLVIFLPFQLLAMLVWSLSIISTKRFKEVFFMQIRHISNLSEHVESFWNARSSIHSWVAPAIQADKDNHIISVCITSSPEFLIAPICRKLGIDHTIGTMFDVKDSKMVNKIVGENNKGKEKVSRFNKWCKANKFTARVANTYTDDLINDEPILSLAENKFYIRGGQVEKISS
jgi:phosphatidylglycerophosphatase C